MTDEQRGIFTLSSSTRTRNTAGLPTTPLLVLRCSGGRVTDLFVSLQAYVGEQPKVQLRCDAGTAYEEPWEDSTDHDALFAELPDVVVDSLLLHRKLAFRFFPYEGTQQTATFVLAPLSSQDAVVRKHCGFSPAQRLAAFATEARRAAQERREKALNIELTPAHDTIQLAPSDVVLTRTLVKRVRNWKGAVLTSYDLSFNIEYVLESRSLAFFGDTLPLESGINRVQVFVNGIPASRTLTYIVK